MGVETTMTVRQLLERYMASRRVSLGAERRDRWVVYSLVSPVLGDRPASEVTSRELVSWAEEVAQVVAATSMAQAVRFLRAGFQYGSDLGLLARNPARGLLPSAVETVGITTTEEPSTIQEVTE